MHATLEDHIIGDGRPALIIAEIGTNHGGDVGHAREMIVAAAEAGADAIKLQKRSPRDGLTTAAIDKPLLLSTGFCDQATVARAVGIVRDVRAHLFGSREDNDDQRPGSAHGKPAILLQCTSAYPTLNHELNLRVIETYRAFAPPFGLAGFSSHAPGHADAVAARALGACIIEKHFSLDRSARGSDHAISLTPAELARLVLAVRSTEEALGDNRKRVLPSEHAALHKLSRSLRALASDETACRAGERTIS